MKRCLIYFLFLLAISCQGQNQRINQDFDKFLMYFDNLNIPFNTLRISNQGWLNYKKDKNVKISEELVRKYIIKKESDMFYNYVDYDMTGGAVEGIAKYWFFYIGKVKVNNFYFLVYQKTNDDTTWTYLSVYTLNGEDKQKLIISYNSNNNCEKSFIDSSLYLTICNYGLLKESYTKSFYIKNSDTIWTGGIQLKEKVKYKSIITISKYKFDNYLGVFIVQNNEERFGMGSIFDYCDSKRGNLQEDDPLLYAPSLPEVVNKIKE